MPATSRYLRTDPYLPEETKFRREFLVWALVVAALFSGVLLIFPEIDLSIAAAMREACLDVAGSRGWCGGTLTEIARHTFVVFFALASLAAVAAAVRTSYSRRGVFGLAQARCWFLVATLVAGPGLVANIVLKDNWGRARPREVVEFGGTKQFTPPLMPASECARNCAFVSGEAASVFVPFFALALLVPHFRAALIAGGIAAGTLAGLIRMSQGAHFLSDILFAGIFMALTVSVVHILTIGIWRDAGRDRVSVAILDHIRPFWRSLWPVPTPPGSSPKLP